MSASFGGLNIINYYENNIEVKPVLAVEKNIKALEDSMFLFLLGIKISIIN